MTYEELNSLFFLHKRIEYLRQRLKELSSEDGLNGVNYDGMPHGFGSSSPVERIALKKALLIEEYNQAIEKALQKEIKISAYIEATEDSEVKLIMQRRFLQFMTYEQIAAEVHSDRTTVSKKLRRYLNSKE